MQEGGIGQRGNALGVFLIDRPDHRAAMPSIGQIEQRQQGQGPGRKEDFPSHAIVRAFVRDPGDEGAVVIVPAGRIEPRLGPGRRAAPFGADQQTAAQDPAIAQRDGNAMLAALALDRLNPARPGDRRFGLRRLKQREANFAVGVHPPQRALIRLGLEIDPPRLHPVRHRNRLNRAAQRIEPIFQPDVGEQVPAGGRDRRGAAIDPFGGQLLGQGLVDHMAGDPVLGRCQGQGHPDQSAAQDNQIAFISNFVAHGTAQVFPAPPSISRHRPSKVPSGSFKPSIAAKLGAISTVSTGCGCSKPSIPRR